MSKKSIVIVELVLYVFITVIMGSLIFSITRQFFTAKSMTEQVQMYSQEYGSMLKELYKNGDHGWTLSGVTQTGIYLNSGSKYKAYKCYTGKFSIYEYDNFDSIDWQTHTGDYVWDNIDCQNLTGYFQTDENLGKVGYWIKLKVDVANKDHTTRHFIKNLD